MASEKKTKIALVRGDSLNLWEGKLWEQLPDTYEVVGFCSRKNLYATNLEYPVERIFSSTDNSFLNRALVRTSGRFQWMPSLEKKVSTFDIAHTSEISYFFTTQAVRAKKINPNLKVVATVWDNSFGRFEYNYWPMLKSPPAFWRNKINKIIKENIQGVDMFLPVSTSSRAMLADYGVDERKMKIVVPAVIPSTVSTQDVVKRLGLEGKELYLAVSRLVKEKGIYDIVYAWKSFIQSNSGKTPRHLCFIGNGRERENLERLISECGLRNSVTIISSLPNNEVRALYGYARCLILASVPNALWQEQFGYVLAEAITMHCPVISTYSGAIPEVIEGAGILVPPLSPAALKDALLELSLDDKHTSYQKKCVEVSKKFEVESFVRNLTAVYESLHA